MKTRSKSLFHLIKALTKEERSYILRTAIHYRKGGRNILVQLFKAMENFTLDNYDEKKLVYKIPNLSVRKNELYETILKSLADKESQNMTVIMLGKLRWAAMLHYRRLFPEAISLLTEIEEWAKHENQLYIHGVILQYKTFFANTGLYKNHNINFSSLGDIMVVNARNILEVTEIYRQYIEVAKITRSTFLLRTSDEIQHTNLLLNARVYQLDISSMPVSSQSFFHLSLYYLYKLHADYENAYREAAICWELMNKKMKDFSKRRPQEYLIGFIAYIAASLDARKLSACKNWLPELKKLWLEKYDGYAVIGGRYYCLLLAYQYLESGPSIKSTVVKEVEDFLIKQETILEEGGEARAIKYLLVVVFFSRRDFSRAWDYCQSILNSSATAPRKELFDATRLLFLLVLVESKKLEELEYYCRQLEGFVRKKEKKEYLLERTLVKHFKQLSNPLLSSKDQQVILGDLNTALKKIETMNNLCAKQLMHYFDFRGWVQERMERLANK